MTTSATHAGPRAARFAGLRARFMSGMRALARFSHTARCASEAERLFRLSDVELARRGLSRDRIIQHAFRSYL